MWRVFWISFGVISSIIALLIWVSVNATFLFHHPRTAGLRVEIDKRTGAAVVVTPVAATATKTKTVASVHGQPRAVTSEEQYDFGVMDPLAMGRHEFVIRNTGDAPLKLEVGPTTCKCTLSGLSRNVVPPGETAIVTLEWNTGRDDYYAHSGTISTNDPARKWLEFKVRGQVRKLLGVDHADIVIERLEPNQKTVVERLLYSQIWESFAVRDVSSRFNSLTWESMPVDPASAPDLKAKSIVRLRITIPDDLPPGETTDELRVQVQPVASELMHTIDLSLQTRILKGIGVYGAAVDERGIIELGTIPQGKGAKAQLIIKIRGADLDLSQIKPDITPNMLSARIEREPNQTRGLYRLIVELDPQAPPCAFRGNSLGRLRIDTFNPKLGTLDLGVSFAVLPRQPL